MTLVDTSAWVEFLRASGSPTHLRLRELVGARSPLFTTDVVVMEVLAGARGDEHLVSLRRLLNVASFLPTEPSDYEEAASLYRRCRAQGATVRKLTDCLIAAVAIRHEVAVLHNGGDFDLLAHHTELEVASR